TLGAGFVFTTPGIPMLFQGQEFLEGGWFRDNVPLDWAQDSEFKGIVRLYRDLIGLRRNLGGVTAGLTGGNVQIITADDTAKVIAYHRWMDGGAGDDVVVVANLSDKHLFDYWIGLPNAGEWVLRFNSDANDYSPAFTDVWTTNIHAITPGRDGMPASGGMALGPYTMLVFSQEP
ncbi:MAG TPA: 1,4-alpha-glucan branching protein, partial [Propionibacteriaceae bacterium]|nr:1,4-alpha-glucan branching protein [Propionibacteriaceae bacterium]